MAVDEQISPSTVTGSTAVTGRPRGASELAQQLDIALAPMAEAEVAPGGDRRDVELAEQSAGARTPAAEVSSSRSVAAQT